MNPLASLIGNYGDSDDESDTESGPQKDIVGRSKTTAVLDMQNPDVSPQSASIHPAPIAHCPWSACYDDSSGFTYYWNQNTNAVTWEAPPEYLLALKLKQQQLHSQGSTTEVSVEEWQLYQQALAEKKQSKVISKGALIKPTKKNDKTVNSNNKGINKKRKFSDVEDEKIELITSYYNSDSESNEEPETPVKTPLTQPPLPKPVKSENNKLKTKPATVKFGPTLPANQNYSVPIGPELPHGLSCDNPKSPLNKVFSVKSRDEVKKIKLSDNEDSNDDSILLTKLKDKANLLQKLGGELPSGLQKIIEEETKALSGSPKLKDIKSTEDSIDEMLNEIERKELPKVKTQKIDMFDEVEVKSNDSPKDSPRSRDMTPPIEHKPLFPSIKNISVENQENPLPCPTNITENVEKPDLSVSVAEKKGANLYLMDSNEPIENISRKKLRLSNSVLPERKRNETPSYTTKYSEHIEGFSNERTGLGFTNNEEPEETVRNTISYGKGLTFTKGETLNEEKRDEDLDILTDLVEAKLKYLNQLQPSSITPVQEMLIQMQTLVSAYRSGALGLSYWRRWTEVASCSLQQHESSAAPVGWTCVFQRYITCNNYPPRPRIDRPSGSEGRYQYRREADGFIQWEYPAVASTDMDISTTPPHPGIEEPDDMPPLPLTPPLPTPPPSQLAATTPAPPTVVGALRRVQTPPPPEWVDPPPPGCDDLLPLPIQEQHREIGDELMSFYNDIAELEKNTSEPPTAPNSPSPPTPPHCDKEKSQERDRETKVNKKKSKVKISTSVGLKHRSVSTLVAKWQQVADEITSD